MIDRFGRKIEYLRVSVTDRCTLRCPYCKPDDSAPRTDPMLSFEEIRDVVRAAAEYGFIKVRLTGGEPLLRPGIVELVGMLSRISGIADLAMTTNGQLLEKFAADLARAGLGRVNVHLDTVNPERYRRDTGGELARTLAGIAAAKSAGLEPVKLNCVVDFDKDESDAREVAIFALEQGLEARYIRRMDRRSGEFFPVIGGRGGDCPLCNRLRLTCDGRVMPCLFSDMVFSVRELGAEQALKSAVANKPESGGACREHQMFRIGG
ncbi:MAG TPA: radical SAM protein [Candidatus Brocadiia bacterium]|nr:radical SAM protein [Candidatus Brocadiia bacterium]